MSCQTPFFDGKKEHERTYIQKSPTVYTGIRYFEGLKLTNIGKEGFSQDLFFVFSIC